MSLPIRSESSVDLTKIISPELQSNVFDKILLHTRRRNYTIKLENFQKHSLKIKNFGDQAPRIIDLTCYNVDAVRALADFLCNVNPANMRINSLILLDLLQLVSIFDLVELKEFLSMRIIENIELGKDSPSAFIFNLSIVMSNWSLYCDDRVRQRLFSIADILFPQIQNSSYLTKFPLTMMILLLSRCKLKIFTEMDIAMIALKWLSLRNFTRDNIRGILSTVRSALLTSEEFKTIENKAKEIGYDENMITIINAQLNSVRNQRCCIIKDHQNFTMKRCGVPKDKKNYTQEIPFIDIRDAYSKYFQCSAIFIRMKLK